MTTYLFPGQGSQHLGMGEELFGDYPEWVDTAEALLGYSIRTLCLSDPNEVLNQTQYTQPALYLVNALSYRARGGNPDWLIGHSLGEYNALLAAGVFDFETGLQLVQERGRLMSQAMNGAMAAIIGFDEATIEHTLKESGLQDVHIANYNAYTQMVISGKTEAIAQAQTRFETLGAKLVVPLKVSGAFHSKAMEPAYHAFKAYLAKVHLNEPRIPVIANATAAPYQMDTLKETLALQIKSPVRFTQSIVALLESGETTFEEIGPGKVLSGLVRRIKMQQ